MKTVRVISTADPDYWEAKINHELMHIINLGLEIIDVHYFAADSAKQGMYFVAVIELTDQKSILNASK